MLKFFFYLFLTGLWISTSCKNTGNAGRDHVAWADTVAEHSLNLMSGTEPASAIRYLDSSYATLSDPGITDLWKKYNLKVGYYTHYERDLQKRRMYVDSMLLVLKKVPGRYEEEYSHSLFLMAGLLQEEKKYNQAFQIYYQGRNFARAHLENCSLSEFSNALGIIRYKQEQYTAAIPYLRQAFQEIESCDNPSFEIKFIHAQSILNTTALCFQKSNMPDSAVKYYNRAIHFIISNQKLYPNKQNFMTMARAVVEGNLGGVYAQMGRFDEAEKHLLTNISLNDRPGFGIEDAQTAKLKLIRLYIDHNLLSKASNLLDQLGADLSSGRGKSIAHADIWENWYHLKWLYYDKTGDIVAAYRFSNKYHTYRDSLDHLQKGIKEVDMDQVLREQDQKYKLSLLEKDSQLKTTYVIGLSTVLAMALSLSLVIWLYYHRSRTNVRNLTAVNNQMQQALSALENSQLENSKLMKIVAHDLRNPIGAMASVADIMLLDDHRSDGDRELLKLIKDAGNNSLNLVGNLLHMNSTPETNFNREDVNLQDLAQQCADMLAIRASQKQQEIMLDLKPVILRINYEKMWRVVSNLISNALKFSPSGSKIYLSIQTSPQYATLTVRDEGIGIPPESGNKIFDAFTRSKRNGTAGEESFGLGLSITKQIVEAHGGTIHYESDGHSGTAFIIQLPMNTAV
ncbi:Adaptive-response sensory-kinase SasA [Dyadobacter sp. CECT 9275]|uniref:histidine kinase n=1 Tax=Dyadobacter helix TaxID=2822344 RepID=A0A916NBQ5_9BACT|nr:HAMP domain-containing sensor histidine kinase [Dyadobacter sp. CECT 9275]CAG4999490.1 Adaptive-response sensory-kinase SasA [Dyadobacter sp. CECT 9275]